MSNSQQSQREGSRPRILDLFCGAGGCAVGYHRAGFDVVGVDIRRQKDYPFQFVQAEALEYARTYGAEYDAIHASPPCQAYSRATPLSHRGNHAKLIPQLREILQKTGANYVIEGVYGSGLQGILLCGSYFGLRVIRHRIFESNLLILAPAMCCHHKAVIPFEHKNERAFADAMGCNWMPVKAARQAIPPAYTEFIGQQILKSRGGE